MPADRLQASNISDTDIGFVKVGLPVNVSVDSFPQESLDTSMELWSSWVQMSFPQIGSQQYRFPATASLKSKLSGGNQIELQVEWEFRRILNFVLDCHFNCK